MISFAFEPLSVAWDDIARLADECWNEIEADKHVEPHNMRRERYREYEDAGMLYCAIARDGREAIGFGIGIVYDSLHTQVRICVDDGIYLKPAYRGHITATRFMQFMERYAASIGVVEMQLRSNMGGKFARILEFLDYRPTAVQYLKRLSRADSAYPSTAVTENNSNEHGRLTEQTIMD